MKWQPQKMVWWYWALIDEMIANPECTKKELAARFKVSEMCICLITTSDVFNAYLSERRAGNSRMLDEAIKLKLTKVADRTLEMIGKVLEKKQDSIPLDQLTSLADKTLERLGYGVKGGVTVNTNGNTQVVVPVSIQDLEAARKALRVTEMAKIEQRQSEHDNTGAYNQFERLKPAAMHGGDVLEAEHAAGSDRASSRREPSLLDL